MPQKRSPEQQRQGLGVGGGGGRSLRKTRAHNRLRLLKIIELRNLRLRSLSERGILSQWRWRCVSLCASVVR